MKSPLYEIAYEAFDKFSNNEKFIELWNNFSEEDKTKIYNSIIEEIVESVRKYFEKEFLR